MENRREIAKVYRKVSLKNQPGDFAYWQSKNYEERLAALEAIRQEYHGWEQRNLMKKYEIEHIGIIVEQVMTLIKKPNI